MTQDIIHSFFMNPFSPLTFDLFEEGEKVNHALSRNKEGLNRRAL
jgi:hypothetical protein